jgi:hypothetical protein
MEFCIADELNRRGAKKTAGDDTVLTKDRDL